MEHCPAPFLGLTVQPCDEPCGSAAGFDFLTVEVIQIGKKMAFLSAWIYASGLYRGVYLEGSDFGSWELLRNIMF
jgi:hypothetical protein